MGDDTAELSSIRDDLNQVRAWLLDYSHALAELYAHAEEVGESLIATRKRFDETAQHMDGQAKLASDTVQQTAAVARTLGEEAQRLSAGRVHLSGALEALTQRVSGLEATITAQVADALGSLQESSLQSAGTLGAGISACSASVKEESQAIRQHIDALGEHIRAGLGNAHTMLGMVDDKCRHMLAWQEHQQQRLAKERDELWARIELLERRVKRVALWLAAAATVVVGGLTVAGTHLWPIR